MQLPSDLQEAITLVTEQRAGRLMPETARKLSDRYRDKRREGSEVMVDADAGVAAYVATRMPATYAALRSCMSRATGALPLWRPASMLDAGAGPGTALWAAAGTWPSLTGCRQIERVDGMGRIGRELALHAACQAVRDGCWVQADLRTAWPEEPADLVTAAYVINELGETEGLRLTERLWRLTKGALILVEPGTPAGWARILKLRDHLLSKGAAVAAPCPHGLPCPVKAPDWCHFTERVNRSRLHRRLKDADMAYEDEKFSYAVMSRLPVRQCDARILRHPLVHPGYLRLSLCTPSGLAEETVTRSRKESYRLARDAGTGDEWPLSRTIGR
jgi:ribosomal protein RSM22 (predicted rRNA methylase)